MISYRLFSKASASCVRHSLVSQCYPSAKAELAFLAGVQQCVRFFGLILESPTALKRARAQMRARARGFGVRKGP